MLENWRKLALKDSSKLKHVFKDAQVDSVINSNLIFKCFVPEMEFFLVPSGTSTLEEKDWYQREVWINYHSKPCAEFKQMLNPFIIFDETKKQDAKDPQRTKWQKS